MSLCERCGRPINAQSQQCDQCGAGSDGLDPQFESFDTLPNLRGPSDLRVTVKETQPGPSTTLLFSPRQSTPMIQERSYTSPKKTRPAQLGRTLFNNEEAALEPIFDQTMSEGNSDIFDSIDAPDDLTALEEYVSELESFDGELPELTHAASFELSGETEVSLLPSVTLEALESPLPDPIDDFGEFTPPFPPTLGVDPHVTKGPPPLSSSPHLTRGVLSSHALNLTPHHRLLLLNGSRQGTSTQVMPQERFSVNRAELTWEQVSDSRFRIRGAQSASQASQAIQNEDIWRVIKSAERLESRSLLRCQAWRFVVRPSTLSELCDSSDLQDLTLGRQDTEGYLTPPRRPSKQKPRLGQPRLDQRSVPPMLIVYRIDADEPRLYGAFPVRAGVTQVGVGTGDVVLSHEESSSPHALFTLSYTQGELTAHPQLIDLWRGGEFSRGGRVRDDPSREESGV